jgi:hypothetical protein
MRGGTVIGAGTMVITSGKGTVNGYGTIEVPVTNNRQLTVTGGTLTVNRAISGTGVVSVGSGATFRSSAGGTISGKFNNQGSVVVNGGGLLLEGGGTSSGTFSTSAGAELRFSGGVHYLTGANTFPVNQGAIVFSGATVSFAKTNVLPGNTMLTAGSLQGSGAVTFTGNLDWSGGTIDTGSLLSTGTATVNGAVAVSCAAENDGTMKVQSGGILNATGGLTNLGNLTVHNGGAVTGAVTVGAATLGGTGSINGPVTLTGDSTLTSTDTLTINNTLTVQGLANQLAGGTIWTTGDVTIDPGAVFIINGTLAGDVGALVVRGTLMGKGNINKNCIIEAGGVLSPGSPSTIQGMAQILNAQSPRNFSFELGAMNPDYANPSNSLNDLIRLTDAAAPFADATGGTPTALSADTVIDVYFLWSDPALGEYRAEFFAATDFTDAIADATYQYWHLDPHGSRFHNGNFFSPLDASLVDWSVVPETATFGGMTTSGYITEFTVVPEPATLALLALGGSLTVLMRRRRS